MHALARHSRRKFFAQRPLVTSRWLGCRWPGYEVTTLLQGVALATRRLERALARMLRAVRALVLDFAVSPAHDCLTVGLPSPPCVWREICAHLLAEDENSLSDTNEPNFHNNP